MPQKNKPLSRKPAVRSDAEPRHARARRNSWEPQVIEPQQVDLPLSRPDEVVVPAGPNGRSLVDGRL